MKNIAVFGGTGGLGKKLSEKLVSDYNVISIGSKDVDVTKLEEVEAFFEKNDIDIVLNFSGINYDCFMHKYSLENQDKIDHLLEVNIKGTTNILSSCLPKMRANGFGRVVLISSILAESPVISTGVYSGCKGFLDSLAKTVALENANKGVTCNTIQLGYFDGGLTYKIPENVRESILKSIPMKRFGSIDELKAIIEMFIAVEYISGISLKANGALDF
jgi:3-oxoacyl-[acyl-carrier protein] reductase